MKRLLLLLLILPTCALADDWTLSVYQHPSQDIHISALGDWAPIERSEDENIHELVKADGNLHVVLWYTETERSLAGYLTKMIKMKELTPEAPAKDININGREGRWVAGTGQEGGQDVYGYLAIVPGNKHCYTTGEKDLVIVQAWCAPEDWERYRSELYSIMASVVIPTEDMQRFGATEYEVRSVKKMDAVALNKQIAAGAAAGEAWTREAVLVALHVTGERVQSMKKTVTVDCPGERHEHEDQGVIVVTVTEHGYLDDSVFGHRYRFWLVQDDVQNWVIESALSAQQCRRMYQVFYSADPCL